MRATWTCCCWWVREPHIAMWSKKKKTGKNSIAFASLLSTTLPTIWKCSNPSNEPFTALFSRISPFIQQFIMLCFIFIRCEEDDEGRGGERSNPIIEFPFQWKWCCCSGLCCAVADSFKIFFWCWQCFDCVDVVVVVAFTFHQSPPRVISFSVQPELNKVRHGDRNEFDVN